MATASSMTCCRAVVLLGLVEDELRAATLELERHDQQLVERLHNRLAALWLHEEQHEAAAARAQQLAARRTGLAGALIDFIHEGWRDLARQRALELPALMQQPAEILQRPLRNEDGLALIDHLPH